MNLNSPITLSYVDAVRATHFATVLPLVNTLALASGKQIIVDNVLAPYSYDLPDLAIYVTSLSGAVSNINLFKNAGSGNFFGGYLRSVDFTCRDFYIGVQDTVCTASFVPNDRIQRNSKLKLQINGVVPHSQSCILYFYQNIKLRIVQ